jgi:hypothetical protein
LNLSFVSGSTAQSIDAGKDLWVVSADGTSSHQITGLTGLNGFPHGALWSPTGDALVGAGTLFDLNGLWVIPLTEDRSACAGMPQRLPTMPGDPIDFAGSIVVAPTAPELFVRGQVGEVVLWWRKGATAYVLETTDQLGASAMWMQVSGPYPVVGNFHEVRLPQAQLAPAAFFRLRYP